jgi:hypothetical protein
MSRIALIVAARFGVCPERLGRVGLSLTVRLDGVDELHFHDPDEAETLVHGYGVRDVGELVGRLVWVRQFCDLTVIDRPCLLYPR